MKNVICISALLLLFCAFSFAQNKTTVKVKVDQADALELDASGEPASIGDISKFIVKGGTAPYDYSWKETNEPGKTHTVTIEDANKCTSTIYVNVGGSNIEEIEFEYNAYPNPTNDIVNIPVINTGEKFVLMLIDINGRVLLKETIQTNDLYYPITLNSCPTGKYFIQTIGNTTKTYSIIKK